VAIGARHHCAGFSSESSNATINRFYEGTNRIQPAVIVTGAAALILAAFGLDSVPEVGGLGAPAPASARGNHPYCALTQVRRISPRGTA
jgi:hypothetical protein